MKPYLFIPVFLGIILSMHSLIAADMIPAKETQVLQNISVQGTDRQLGMGIAEFPPNAEKPRHKAIGPEVCYVLEGKIILQVDGQPEKVISAGESFQIAADDVHVTKAGPAGAKVIAAWATIPGKPFNIPVPN